MSFREVCEECDYNLSVNKHEPCRYTDECKKKYVSRIQLIIKISSYINCTKLDALKIIKKAQRIKSSYKVVDRAKKSSWKYGAFDGHADGYLPGNFGGGYGNKQAFLVIANVGKITLMSPHASVCLCKCGNLFVTAHLNSVTSCKKCKTKEGQLSDVNVSTS